MDVKPTTFVLTAALMGVSAAAFLPSRGAARAATDASPSPAASTSASASASPAASPAPSSAAAKAASFTVDTKQFVYSPTPLTVPAGSTVVFKNSDPVAHTVTAADGSFDSKNMDKGQTWSHVFAKAGTYDYVCAYHAFMKGEIIVK